MARYPANVDPSAFQRGDRFMYGEFPATIIRHYHEGMWEVRVPGGEICIGASELTPILTTKLNSGVVVLAKLYQGTPSAMTFANRTQAEAAAARTGGWVWRGMGRPFFVRFDITEQEG